MTQPGHLERLSAEGVGAEIDESDLEPTPRFPSADVSWYPLKKGLPEPSAFQGNSKVTPIQIREFTVYSPGWHRDLADPTLPHKHE